METTAPSSAFIQYGRHNEIPISILQLRIAWILFVAITIVSELWPMPILPRGWFYSILSSKLLGFGIVGLLVPLAFRRFSAFVRGLLFALGTAGAIEVIQGLISHGHTFHLHELFVKFSLIVGAFCAGVLARYEGIVSVGPISIRLNTRHRPYFPRNSKT